MQALLLNVLPASNVLALSASASLRLAQHVSPLLQHTGQSTSHRCFSTQHEEELRVPNPSSTQAPESPPITPDTSTAAPGGQHTSDGRSSQTTSTQVAGEGMKSLVHKVFQMYEARSLEQQRQIIRDLYDEAAIYENNVALLHNRDAIQQRFALLPLATKSVGVEYENPVVLGATTSGPEVLDNLATKGELQVEVKNKQRYVFDRAHSMWRMILLPHGDLELPVLTRLTLNRDGSKILYHRDIWVHNSTWWAPLQRCWGVVEKAAAGAAKSEAHKA